MKARIGPVIDCPVCGAAAGRVVDSRRAGKRVGGPGVRRRRECASGHRFTTIEKCVETTGKHAIRDLRNVLANRIDEVLR